MRISAVSGEKAVVERPWKDEDQSMPFSPAPAAPAGELRAAVNSCEGVVYAPVFGIEAARSGSTSATE